MILCDARIRESGRLGGVPGRAGRAADARDRGEGGRVPRSAARRRFARLLRADRRQRARARAAALGERGFRIVSGGTDNHLFLLSLVDRDADRQGGARGARPRGHHREQEHGAVRSAQAVRDLGAALRHAGASPRAACARAEMARDRRPDRARARAARGRRGPTRSCAATSSRCAAASRSIRAAGGDED